MIRGRPGVPVVINGHDASYAVGEGDGGLSRPGAVPVTVIGGSPILPNPVYTRRHATSKFLLAKALPQKAADPVMRLPVPMQILADDASVPPLAPRPVKSLPAPMRVPTPAAPASILETNAAAGYVCSAWVSSPDSMAVT